MTGRENEVLIVSCEDDPRAAGRIGYVLDEEPPGELTDYRWTVSGLGFFIGDVLCFDDELEWL
ncbi:hypothetical protein [Streptomyces sp. NPDC047525]|uniref:hypothetical protein n=1 Tax=Streptomyces sp. NPDC047525 TaxID=3155264 RepID=UPI0033C309CD